jgi:hypothetical protein
METASRDKPAGLKGTLRRILAGYGRLFTSLALWVLACLGAVAAAAAVVWPLWALATESRLIFNFIVLSLALAALATLAAVSVRRRLATGEGAAAIARKFSRGLVLCLCLLALLLSGYLCLAFSARGLVLAAIPAGLACLALAGYLFFGRKRA